MRSLTLSGTLWILTTALVPNGVVFAQQSASAESKKLPDPSALRPMDGITPKEYGEFWKTWHLVTTRYRNDNGEQRFVYANDLAWAALTSGKLPFPDGAAFAKIAFSAKADPAFPNSFEPVSFTRLQYMKKDLRSYPTSNGWGYALYGRQNKTQASTEEDHNNSVACHACHTIVPDRDFVFSKPAFFDEAASNQTADFTKLFATKAATELNKFEQELLNKLKIPPESAIQYRSMPLFEGSLVESASAFANAPLDDLRIYMLSDPKTKQSIIVMPPLEKDLSCTSAKTIWTTASRKGRSKVAREFEAFVSGGLICNGVIRWKRGAGTKRFVR